MAIRNLTKLDDLKTLQASHKIFIVKFFATWCGPCQMYTSEYVEAAKESDALFAEVNIDEAIDLATHFGVMGVPETIIFKDGVEFKRFSGFKKKDEILDEIK